MLCEFSRRSFLKGSAAARSSAGLPALPGRCRSFPIRKRPVLPRHAPPPDSVWPGAGQGAGGWHPLLVRHPLRGRTHRRGPLDIPPRACPLADSAGLHHPRPGSVSVHQLPPRHRGLSDAGHLFRAGGKKAARPRLSPWQRLSGSPQELPAAHLCGTPAASSWPSVTGWGCSAGTACPPSLPVQTPPETLPCWTSSGHWTG